MINKKLNLLLLFTLFIAISPIQGMSSFKNKFSTYPDATKLLLAGFAAALSLYKGYSYAIQPEKNSKALFNAIKNNAATKTILDLSNKVLDLRLRDADGDTLLIKAVKLGDISLIKVLVNKGININSQDKEGNTALMIAADAIEQLHDFSKGEYKDEILKYLDIVYLLLENEADIDTIRNNEKNSARIKLAGVYSDLAEYYFDKNSPKLSEGEAKIWDSKLKMIGEYIIPSFTGIVIENIKNLLSRNK